MRNTFIRLALAAVTLFAFAHAASADFVPTWP
jgi:hypothetical protein